MTREQEIQDEIQERKKSLNRYFNNIDSLLGIKGSREVKKEMIIHITKNM